MIVRVDNDNEKSIMNGQMVSRLLILTLFLVYYTNKAGVVY